MSTILRLIRCLLGIASPSRTHLILWGDTSGGPSWLDRWERRINEDAARRFVLPRGRVEVQVYALDLTGHSDGLVLFSVDVTGRSERAARRVFSKWRRRAVLNLPGVFVRRKTVWS